MADTGIGRAVLILILFFLLFLLYCSGSASAAGSAGTASTADSEGNNTVGIADTDINLSASGSGSGAAESSSVQFRFFQPVANFSAVPRTGAAPLLVEFTDASTGSITSRKWDFDNDGKTDSIKKNPTYRYKKPGTYTVKLFVKGPKGSDTDIKTGYITVSTCSPPVAGFSASPVTGTAPLTVAFSDESNGTVTVWEWDYENDGIIDSSGQNPVFTYTQNGTYTVALTVTGPYGSDKEIRSGYIKVSRNIIPLPGYSNPPTDPDEDGLYEDLNVNTVKDTNDVVLFFRYQRWIQENEPIPPFDFNDNGTIDTNDVVLLFKKKINKTDLIHR